MEVPNQFTWVKSIDATSQDSETVLDFFKSATEVKCEGITLWPTSFCRGAPNILAPVKLISRMTPLLSKVRYPTGAKSYKS